MQLWIFPEQQNVTPYYNQKKFESTERKNKFQSLISPKTQQIEGSLPVNQQAYIFMIDITSDFEIEYKLKNGAYFFLIDGEISIADETLEKRDAIGIY